MNDALYLCGKGDGMKRILEMSLSPHQTDGSTAPGRRCRKDQFCPQEAVNTIGERVPRVFCHFSGARSYHRSHSLRIA